MFDAWHTLSADECASRLDVDPASGLSASSAQARLAETGRNQLVEGEERGIGAMLLAQFTDLLIVILIAAAVVSGVLGDLVDAIAILLIVLLNAAIGVAQEYRTERALEALRELSVPDATVRRDGVVFMVPSDELVPGDIVYLEAGNLIPADIRLRQVAALEVNEASLTGESEAVHKSVPALPAELGIGDRLNMAHRGTVVTYGRGEGLVVATGMGTEIGRIASLLEKSVRPATPLQRRLSRFGKRVAALVLGICALLFAAGVARGVEPLLMSMTAVSLAVAAIPEALPAVVAIALAIGARKLVRQRALIRQLPAVETLGSITVICSDKTGTLTENRMSVQALALGHSLEPPPEDDRGGPLVETMLAALALNNDAQPSSGGEIVGEPTEAALLRHVIGRGGSIAALRSAQPRVAELPFESDRKMMTTVHEREGALRSFTKGAPEAVVRRCTSQLASDAELDARAVLDRAEALAGQGYRVLAVATRRWEALPEHLSSQSVEVDLDFVGLVALLDPPRPEVPDAVAQCVAAGIVPMMITGDHPTTARAIAERIGIAKPGDRVLTGAEMARMSSAELEVAVGDVRVYARVAPEQKIRIVEALQAKGEYVAMTGDGVNDAPALRRANMGVAMGEIGTDVAREAAHMVLLDDNFATIVAAVREGRRIFDNIRKFIRYTMTSNSGELWTLLLAPLLGLPIPLLPVQILWINLVTDGLPGLALTREPEEPGIMRRPPRPPDESIFAGGLGWHMLFIGLLIGMLSIAAQAWAYSDGNAHWQTMVFNVLTFAQLFHVLAIRSERHSQCRIGLFSNRPLIAAVALTFALQVLVTYVGWLQRVFNTQSLSGGELALCVVFAAGVLPVVELEKWLVRRGYLYRRR